MDLFAPRKALTAHLQKLVDSGVIRGVGQAHEFADIMAELTVANDGFVYVTYDNYSNVASQSSNSQKMTQAYTLYLAVRNNRPARSHHGHGMDDAGETLSAIMLHVQGLSAAGDKPSPGMSKRFNLAAPSEATRYRSGGWAFYPITFAIDVVNARPFNANKP